MKNLLINRALVAKKKLFTFFLALVASAGTVCAESGTCGTNLTWDLTGGVLTISGTGAMTNWIAIFSPSPWDAYKSNIQSVVINDGVTSIGQYAFSLCRGLASVTIPNSVTYIGYGAFFNCTGLASVTIPNSVTSIRGSAFYACSGLDSVTIGDKTYKKQAVTNGKSKAYKGFNVDMTCRDFQYEEGKTYEYEGEPILCVCGFHASLSLPDVFNYYNGEFGKDVVVHEVELEGVDDERNNYDSKVVAKKITIGKRIL